MCFADGHLPISVVMTRLPRHARVWQSDGSLMTFDGTQVIDPLGRIVYDPGTYARGDAVDYFEFTYSSAPVCVDVLVCHFSVYLYSLALM